MASYRRVLVFCSVIVCVCGAVSERNDENVNFPNRNNGRARAMRDRKADLVPGHRGKRTGKQGAGASNLAADAGRGPNAPRQNLVFKRNPSVVNSENRRGRTNNAEQPYGQDPVQPRKPPVPIKIADQPECSKDVKALCSHGSLTNNFAVLDCLQNDIKSYTDVSDMCQHFVWSYKRNLTIDSRFDAAAHEVCKDIFIKFQDCKNLTSGSGHKISCLLEHKDNITSANCKQFLVKMASIVFADYRLVHKFAERCENDIQQLLCGRFHKKGDDAPHSQGKTIECLSQNVRKLNKDCKHEILRIAELQSDDYHMDRPLFYACREDRERFCKRTKAGGGKVFKCLFRHKFERDMSTDCREKLVIRQQLIREDYKVNKGLADACRHDIRKYKCLKSVTGQQPILRQGRLSVVLLCLEGAMQDGEEVTPECIGEMREMRRSLMEDYKINPNIVIECSNEISRHCGGGLQREGKTLHCLMDLARPKAQDKGALEWKTDISNQCLKELKNHLSVAAPGDDFRLDPALHEACQSVAEVACMDISPGDARVIGCLMEKIGTKEMIPDCEERLMEIQFFVARDFKMDPRLYKFCHKDATKHCHASENWYEPGNTTPELGHLVLSCLYRQNKLYAQDNEKQLSRACAFEVKRIIRQRAISVELEPQIEEPCMHDLGFYCSEKTQKGEELYCLQDHFDDLKKECQLAVGNFTEDMDEDPHLDKILMKACTPMINKFCDDLLKQDDTQPGDVMECLIKYKHDKDMNRKCAAGIEHHQLMSLKDFRFSYKFKEACKKDVMQLCEKTSIRKKTEVVRCLSDVVRHDTLLDEDHRLSKNCRRQLRFELLQRGEDIRLDPALKQACEEDRDKFCSNITPGRGQVVECLKKHVEKLSDKCHKKIFKRERVEANEQSADYILMTACKKMVKRHCADEKPNGIVHCLRQYFNDQDFDPRCKKVVLSREEIQARDIRLNPVLFKACKLDIPKFCAAQMHSDPDDKEKEGKVINCLKIKFRAKRLSRNCEDHIEEVIREAVLDFKQDPVLAAACKPQIEKYCMHELAAVSDGADGRGEVVECLKKHMAVGQIKESDCSKEIARVMAEGKADIHVDPLLHRACALDLKHYCHDVPIGEGRQMSCLLSALDDKTIRLKPECHKRLSDRVAMWEYAAKVAPPETVNDLYSQVVTSPARSYFLAIIFAVIGLIFIGGLFCGRVTKRLRAEAKNK